MFMLICVWTLSSSCLYSLRISSSYFCRSSSDMRTTMEEVSLSKMGRSSTDSKRVTTSDVVRSVSGTSSPEGRDEGTKRTEKQTHEHTAVLFIMSADKSWGYPAENKAKSENAPGPPFLQRLSSASSFWMVSFRVLFFSFSFSYFLFHCSAVSSRLMEAVFLMVLALWQMRTKMWLRKGLMIRVCD